ncbi:MAG: HAD family hydrolase [Streptosporangiaceae bacterium]
MFFDMDGLLVDTERLWFDVERDVMGRLGGAWGEEHQRALVGGPLGRTVSYMLRLSGATVSSAEVGRWLLDGMMERLRGDGVPLLPGARALLEEVSRARVPCALVSSAQRVLVDTVLDQLGREWFDTTVSGTDVPHTKPEPDPYLRAAAALQVDPARCAALEDSPNGVASAEAAGCLTVVVPSVVPIPPAPGRIVLRSLTDVDLALITGAMSARVCDDGPR